MVCSMQNPPNKIPTIYQCNSKGRENHTVVADMDGTLLVGSNSFAYFALIAFDVGGILRLILLFLSSPLAGLLYHFISESAGIRVLIFATFAGVRVSAIKSAANAVLPKFYSEDMHPETWRVFSACGLKYVLTATPRIMVEPYLKNYLGVDEVIGTEISSYKGIATGFVTGLGVLVGKKKAIALRKVFRSSEAMPDIGIGDRKTDFPFMKLCKESYMVPSRPGTRPMGRDSLPKPVIFHDGRLVQKPTPLMSLLIILWFPIGVFLSIMRTLIGSMIPISVAYYIVPYMGCLITIKGTPPPNAKHYLGRKGVVFVCSHRTVIDAVVVSACLGFMSTTISYSVPGLTEFLSPIKTARLTVANVVKGSLFYGTTARGYKWLDPFFFYMNPIPAYEVTFLDKLSPDQIAERISIEH